MGQCVSRTYQLGVVNGSRFRLVAALAASLLRLLQDTPRCCSSLREEPLGLGLFKELEHLRDLQLRLFV